MVHGSFTGIRIGVSTAKAFVDSLNIKGIGISSLEALAYNVTDNGIICSLIDAKKENVYCEIFEKINEEYIVRRKASFENIDNFLLELKSIELNYNITFVGDGANQYKDKILNVLPNSKFTTNNFLSATNLGIAGYNHFIKNEFSGLEPLYIRKSEAEQKLEAKLNENK